jgi:hypothetical protein
MLEGGVMAFDIETQSVHCFPSQSGLFLPEKRWICLKVRRTLTTVQKTELL